MYNKRAKLSETGAATFSAYAGMGGGSGIGVGQGGSQGGGVGRSKISDKQKPIPSQTHIQIKKEVIIL